MNDAVPSPEPPRKPPIERCSAAGGRLLCAGPRCPCCFELFRRAVVAQDGPAWRELHARYHHLVAYWCRRGALRSPDDLDDLVGQTWQRFWRCYSRDKLEAAGSVAAVLRYLKLCAGSVIVDAARARARDAVLHHVADEHDFESPGSVEQDVADAVGVAASWRALWGIVERHLHDERERTLLVLRYQRGMRACEIQAHRPDLFATVSEVHRLNRNILERLRRSQVVQAWHRHERSAAW